MKILNEPISTWISIAAFLISLSTLILALRKQKHDERVFIAGKVREMKSLYGESLRIIDEMLERYSTLEKTINQTSSAAKRNEYSKELVEERAELEDMRSKFEKIYKHLGNKNLKTSNPIVLSSLVVESENIRRDIEEIKARVETDIVDFEKKLETRKTSMATKPRGKQIRRQTLNKKSK